MLRIITLVGIAIWEVFSNTAKAGWGLLQKAWLILSGSVLILLFFGGTIWRLFEATKTQWDAMAHVIENRNDTAHTLLTAGWPIDLIQMFGFVDAYFPVAEMLQMLALLVMWIVVAALIRIVKSFISGHST